MPYFVLVTGVPTKTTSYISFVEAKSSQTAHNIAISEFRRKNDVPSNIQVQSHTVHKGSSLGEATRFYTQLSAKIREAEEGGPDE